LLALRTLYRVVFDECTARGRAIVLYGAWALISLGIGGHLYLTEAVM
jgi:hypothetical protein